MGELEVDDKIRLLSPFLISCHILGVSIDHVSDCLNAKTVVFIILLLLNG